MPKLRFLAEWAQRLLEQTLASEIRQYMPDLGIQPPCEAVNPQMTVRGAVNLLTLLDAGRARIARLAAMYGYEVWLVAAGG